MAAYERESDMSKKKYLLIRQIDNRKEVKRVEVTGRDDRTCERIQMGMLRNLNRDEYFVDELEE